MGIFGHGYISLTRESNASHETFDETFDDIFDVTLNKL